MMIETKIIYRMALVLILTAAVFSGNLRALEIIPEVVGNGSSDSVFLTFETFDTTSVPLVANADSLKILRFGPSGTLIDSLGEENGAVCNIREGSYEVHFRGSDASGTLGKYIVRIYAFKSGQIRGAVSGGYYVRDDNWEALDSVKTFARAVLDTLDDGFASQSNQSNLDAAVSSRSTLTESDNIGIDWVNVKNATAFQYFPATVIGNVGTVMNKVPVDTSAVARSVWDGDIVDPDSRYVNLSACLSGGGAWPCSLFVFNSADSSALQGIRIRFLNQSQNATEAIGITNSEGLLAVSLDAAVYKVWLYKSGVQFSSLPDSILVSEPSLVDTIWGSAFDPGEPVSPELCRTYGWIYDLSGQGISGVTITAGISKSPLRYSGVVISPYYKSAVTDSVGYWQIDLLPSAVMEPDDCQYEFVIYYEAGRIARKKITVPQLSGWQLDW